MGERMAYGHTRQAVGQNYAHASSQVFSLCNCHASILTKTWPQHLDLRSCGVCYNGCRSYRPPLTTECFKTFEGLEGYPNADKKNSKILLVQFHEVV